MTRFATHSQTVRLITRDVDVVLYGDYTPREAIPQTPDEAVSTFDLRDVYLDFRNGAPDMLVTDLFEQVPGAIEFLETKAIAQLEAQ